MNISCQTNDSLLIQLSLLIPLQLLLVPFPAFHSIPWVCKKNQMTVIWMRKELQYVSQLRVKIDQIRSLSPENQKKSRKFPMKVRSKGLCLNLFNFVHLRHYLMKVKDENFIPEKKVRRWMKAHTINGNLAIFRSVWSIFYKGKREWFSKRNAHRDSHWMCSSDWVRKTGHKIVVGWRRRGRKVLIENKRLAQ